MSRSKRGNDRRSHRTRYRHTSAAVNRDIFRIGESKNHAVRDGPFSYDFYHSVLDNARYFDKSNRDFIYAYQVVIFAIDNHTNQEFSFTVQKLRAIRFKQNDDDVFSDYEERADEILNKSSTDYEIRFMRIILVSEKEMKQKLDIERKQRSEKQRIGREREAHERSLQKREKQLAEIRHTKEQNKKAREEGKLKPAKKRTAKGQKRTWI